MVTFVQIKTFFLLIGLCFLLVVMSFPWFYGIMPEAQFFDVLADMFGTTSQALVLVLMCWLISFAVAAIYYRHSSKT